jgi:hypothetical protein
MRKIANNLEKRIEFLHSIHFPFDLVLSAHDQLPVLDRKIAEMSEGFFEIKRIVELFCDVRNSTAKSSGN